MDSCRAKYTFFPFYISTLKTAELTAGFPDLPQFLHSNIQSQIFNKKVNICGDREISVEVKVGRHRGLSWDPPSLKGTGSLSP